MEASNQKYNKHKMITFKSQRNIICKSHIEKVPPFCNFKSKLDYSQ